MSGGLKVYKATSSGKIRCRFDKNYNHEIIPKGQGYLCIEGVSAGGHFKIAICKHHLPMFDDGINLAISEIELDEENPNND